MRTIEAIATSALHDSLYRYVPTSEPWLSQWCRLDTLHRLALKRTDEEPDDMPALRACMWLATAKTRIWDECRRGEGS